MDNQTDRMPDTQTLYTRQVTYSFLAELFNKEVDEKLLLQLRRLLDITKDDPNEAFARMAQSIDETSPQSEVLDNLAVDFASVFLAANNLKQAAFPYESVYTNVDGLLQQESTVAVEQIYARRGFVQHMRYKVPADHVSLEFSYMAWLCEELKAAADAGECEAVRHLAEEQKSFFTQHIQTWIFQFIKLGKKYAKTGFYQDLFVMCEEFMITEEKHIASVA